MAELTGDGYPKHFTLEDAEKASKDESPVKVEVERDIVYGELVRAIYATLKPSFRTSFDRIVNEMKLDNGDQLRKILMMTSEPGALKPADAYADPRLSEKIKLGQRPIKYGEEVKEHWNKLNAVYRIGFDFVVNSNMYNDKEQLGFIKKISAEEGSQKSLDSDEVDESIFHIEIGVKAPPEVVDFGFPSGVNEDVKEGVFGSMNISGLPDGAEKIKFLKERQLSEAEKELSSSAAGLMASLQEVYSRDLLLVHHSHYGITDSLKYTESHLHSGMTVLEMIQTIDEIINGEALAYVADIKAIYDTNRYKDNHAVLDQDNQPLNDGQLYYFGVRVGLSYCRDLLQKLTANEVSSEKIRTDKMLPPRGVLGVMGSFASEQKYFVKEVLPKLRESFSDRPSVYKWSYDAARRDLQDFTGYSKKWNLESVSLTDLSWVDIARSNPQVYYGLRNGFGREELSLSKNNKFLDLDCPPSEIPEKDLQEVIRTIPYPK